MDKCIMNHEDIQNQIRYVFGRNYEFESIERIYGGAQKGTYKITCTNKFTCVLYIWDHSCTYFDNSEGDIFTSNSAIHFECNRNILVKNNISTPEIYHIDISKSMYPFEYAFVEYVKGSDLEVLLNDTDENCLELLSDLKRNIDRLHSIRSDYAGDLLNLQSPDFRCEDYIQQELDKELKYLFDNYSEVNRRKDKIIAVNNVLYNNIDNRKEYHLIHWELGPNHVMVDENDKTYLIDIEGMKYFDLEYEHSFLQLRFDKSFYKILKNDTLDNNRVLFYKFYHHISCISGAHQLLQKNYYDIELVKGIINYNLKQLNDLYL